MKESIRCRGLAAAVALGAALTAPAPAIAALPLRATIVEGVGMGGVRLGMTERRVRSIWGPPGKFTPCQKLIGRADRVGRSGRRGPARRPRGLRGDGAVRAASIGRLPRRPM